MLTVQYDEEAGLAVWYFSGSENTDADYELYCTSIVKLDQRGARDVLRVGILVTDANNPVPNAAWRKRIAEASAHVRPNTLFVLATERALVRGIMTAINWIRPPTYTALATSTFDEALEVVARERPDAVARLRELYAAAQAGAVVAETA